MDSSAPKRRKISPTASAPGGEDGQVTGSSDGAARQSGRRRRPSFASPTKSSLARANPDVLERRNAARAQRQSSAPAASQPGSADSDGSVSDLLAAQLGDASETGPTSDHEDSGTRPDPAEAGSPVRRAAGGMGAKPRRTPTKPSPRPLPRPSSREEELLDPFRGRAMRRSPPPGVLPAVEQEEPELPPTPTEKGISDPSEIVSSSAGIHNTPSKRPRRSRALAEKMKSSPLKQPPMRPPEFGKQNTLASRPLRRKSRAAVEKTDAFRATLSDDQRRAHPARGVGDFDPLEDRNALRDALRAEAAQLRADLDVATKENDRLFQQRDRHHEATVLQEPEDGEALLDVLRRHVLPIEKEAPSDSVSNWLEAAMNPISFLPFGSSGSSLPLHLENLKSITGAEEEKEPPTSHYPIPMTTTEELPYLQLYTPLAFTSLVTMVPRESQPEDQAPGPLMQQHTITVSSTPRGLFTARIEMLVNTKSFTISKLAVPRLDPASVAELGPFINGILESPSNSALKRNVTVITAAMADWTRIASKRARLWANLERELGTIEAIRDCAAKIRKRRKRKAPVPEEDDGEDSTASATKNSIRMTDLLPYLGQTSFDLVLGRDDAKRGPSLRLDWRIGFDWTGEAQSKIGIMLRAPGKWYASDERQSLAGVPDLFDGLLQKGKEPMDAVKTVVALLVGDGKG